MQLTHPWTAAATLFVATLILAGCSASTGPDPAPPIEEPAAAEPFSEPAPAEPTITAPDPCSVLSPDAVAIAAGVGGLGTPTLSTDSTFVSGQDAWGEFRDVAFCSLALSDEARAQLGIDTGGREAGALDIVLRVSAYNGTVYSSGGTEWSDTNPIGLVDSYVAANSERIGTNAVAQRLSDTVVQDGSTVIAAVNDSYWTEVTFFMCHFDDCGRAALAVSDALSAAFPTT